MSPVVRTAHLFGIGALLVFIALFTWAWVVTGQDEILAWVGWCIYFGALSSHALWSDRKKSSGVKV